MCYFNMYKIGGNVGCLCFASVSMFLDVRFVYLYLHVCCLIGVIKNNNKIINKAGKLFTILTSAQTPFFCGLGVVDVLLGLGIQSFNSLTPFMISFNLNLLPVGCGDYCLNGGKASN